MVDNDEEKLDTKTTEDSMEDPHSEGKKSKSLKQKLAEETEKADQYKDNWQRAEADLVNFRKRTEQEKNELTKFANSALLCTLLPVLDDFERAFEAIPADQAEAGWVDGINLILRKFQTVMESQGVSKIEAVGKSFDPSIHEAIAQQDGEEGIVLQEVQTGYMYKDKVLRPSMVVVGNGAQKTEQSGE